MKRYREDVLLSYQTKRLANAPRLEQSAQIQMSTANTAQILTTTDALSYLRNVKERFQGRRDKYEEFLDVIQGFKSDRIDTAVAILKVKELLKGNRDLILGFNTFLPKGYEIILPPEDEPLPTKKRVKLGEAKSFISKIKATFQGSGGHEYKAFLDICIMHTTGQKSVTEVYQEVADLFHDHADLLVDFTHFLPEASSGAFIQHAQSGRNHILHRDNRGSLLTITRSTQVNKKFAVYDGHFHHHDSEPFEEGKDKVEDTERYEWKHDDNLGHKRKSASQDDCASNQFHQGMLEMELNFRNKVKVKLQDPKIDEKLSDCIRSFKSKFVTAAQFRNLVTTFLGTDTDVLEACEDFLTAAERNGSLQKNKLVFRSSKADGDVEDHDIRERDRHNRGLASNTRDVIGQKMSKYASNMSKAIRDLDLSNSKRCSPSYRLLPENYPIPIASGRTEIEFGAEVLNDHWVSVTSGSEDSFKHMQKNQYEEILSQCEDDRSDFDMLLELVDATAKRIEEFLDSMNAPSYKIESSFCIEDHLSALHLRCIERLYGDHGLDVIDALRKNAPLALPVILIRLKQKHEEWTRCRGDFNKVWGKIYAKNYHKSLDYRSFSFKQQDTKNLSSKALLAEVKEKGEKNLDEDEMVLSVTAAYTPPTKPHMEFEYPDLNIQEDIYQLMKYSCGEVCAPEECDKVMKIWTTFMEPFFGGTSCPPNAGCKKYVVKADNHTEQNSKHICQENSDHSDVFKREDEHIPSKDSFPRAQVRCADEENRTCSKDEREEGELSPNRSLEESSFVALGTTDAKTEPTLSKSEPTVGDTTEEGMCVEVVGGEPEANEADEGEKCAHVSSYSENGDASVNESANGKECSPEECCNDGNHDEKDKWAEREGEADCTTSTEGATPISDRLLQTVKPLKMDVPAALLTKEKKHHIFYGNDSFYLLFRLHQMLYERMKTAKLHSSSPENKWRFPNNANSVDSYFRFKEALHSLLNGSLDHAKFEDECRALVGAQAYLLFTLDKLIHKLVKQLQIIATEGMGSRLLELHEYERSRSPETFSDAVYYENARVLLLEDNVYRIEFSPESKRLTMELVKNERDKLETFEFNDELLSVPETKEKSGVFMKRNKKLYAREDEDSGTCKAMEGLVIRNCVEMRTHPNSLKIQYVIGTEDFLYRPRKRRRDLYGPLSAKRRKLKLD